MKSNMSSKKLISALAMGALAAVALGSNACSSTQAGAPEPTSSANSAELAPLTCTPLLTTAPVVNCGAITADQISTAASVQSSLAAQMQAALASLTITANVAQQQVVIASQADAFSALFGSQIVAPLIPDGFFTATVPLTVGSLAPNFALQATVFGLVPGVFTTTTPALTTGTTLTPFLDTTTNATFAAFNASTLSSTNTAAVNTSAINAATAPLTFFFSTPIATTVPLTCAATVPLGCL